MSEADTELLHQLLVEALREVLVVDGDDTAVGLYHHHVAHHVEAALRARLGEHHFVILDPDDGWRIQHPLDCRLAYDDLDCPTNQAVGESSDEDRRVRVVAGPGAVADRLWSEIKGRWRVELVHGRLALYAP